MKNKSKAGCSVSGPPSRCQGDLNPESVQNSSKPSWDVLRRSLALSWLGQLPRGQQSVLGPSLRRSLALSWLGQLPRGQQSVLGHSLSRSLALPWLGQLRSVVERSAKRLGGRPLASISWLIPVGSLAERPAKRCRMITKISDPEHCFSNFPKERQSTTGARLSRVSLLLQKAAAFKALAVSGSLAGWAAAALARPSGARAGGLSTKSCVPSAAPLPSVLPLCLSFRPPLPLYPAPFLSPAIPIMMGGQARARLTQLVLRIHLRLRSSTLVLEKPQRSE